MKPENPEAISAKSIIPGDIEGFNTYEPLRFNSAHFEIERPLTDGNLRECPVP